MKTAIHPAAFLASAAAVSGGWLWFQHAAETAAPGGPSSAWGAARAGSERRASVRVDPSVLRRYAGRYDSDGLAVQISVEGDRLIVQAGDLGSFGLRAASETKFFFEDFAGTITFEAGEPSPAFVADLTDGRHRGVRVGRQDSQEGLGHAGFGGRQ